MAQAYYARTSDAHSPHRAPTRSSWKPLRRMRTHEQVMAEIESRLISGELKAGDRLPPERQFAEALGVSRGAVREALRILEAIGVVEAGAGSGPTSGSMIVKDSVAGMAMVLRLHLRLASFTQDDLRDVRFLIEDLAARNAAEGATSDDIAELRSLVAEMRVVDTVDAYQSLQAAFDARIVRASGNGLAAVLLAALRDTQRHAGTGDLDDSDDTARAMQALTEDYETTVEAIAAGSARRAAELATGLANALRRAG